MTPTDPEAAIIGTAQTTLLAVAQLMLRIETDEPSPAERWELLGEILAESITTPEDLLALLRSAQP